MTTRRFRAALAAGVTALTLVTASVPAHAQWIVYDPTNFSQNVLTAARNLALASPHLVPEWHPTANRDLRPDLLDITQKTDC